MTKNPCFYWDRANLTMPTGAGLPTTLMVQSALDPATDYSLAVSAHRKYGGSRLVTINQEGDHGTYRGVDKCADKIVNTFLTTGGAPANVVTGVGEGLPAPAVQQPGFEDSDLDTAYHCAGSRIHKSRLWISALTERALEIRPADRKSRQFPAN